MKKKVISVRDIIFDKDMIWDKKLIPYFNNNIKELDKPIIYIKISESKALEIKNIHFI